jgi:microcystin-dependent protein
MNASSETANTRASLNNYLAAPGDNTYQNPPANMVVMNPAMTTNPVGGNQAHLNMQPFLVLNFIIALQGIFPSPT